MDTQIKENKCQGGVKDDRGTNAARQFINHFSAYIQLFFITNDIFRYISLPIPDNTYRRNT